MILINEARKVYRRLALVKKRYETVNAGKDMPSETNGLTADRRRQGFSYWDSFCYELRNNDHRDYISTWEEWQPRKNRTAYFKISDDKYLFSCVFGPYIPVPPTYGLIEQGKLVDVDIQSRDIYDRLREAGGYSLKTGLAMMGSMWSSSGRRTMAYTIGTSF